MYLLQGEGLLDEEKRGQLEPVVLRQMGWFETAENVRVAELIMVEETLCGKVWVAFAMWGRSDAADEGISEALRELAALEGGSV